MLSPEQMLSILQKVSAGTNLPEWCELELMSSFEGEGDAPEDGMPDTYYVLVSLVVDPATGASLSYRLRLLNGGSMTEAGITSFLYGVVMGTLGMDAALTAASDAATAEDEAPRIVLH